MINTSQTYQDEIYDDTTKTKCSVIYGAYDVSAKNLATATSNGQQTFSPPSQTLNGLNNYTTYTDLEINNWKLDGKTRIFPSNTSTTEWGWWSLSLSDGDGYFSNNPTLTYTWNENHTSVGITIQSNYPLKQFNIYWYDSNNTLIDSESVTNSDMTKLVYEVENGVVNYQKIVIEFVQTIPYHYIKIQDILFGKEYIWNDEIIELSVDETLDEKMQRLESNQTTIKLNNIDDSYNKYSPDNKLQYFQEGQIMQVYNTAFLSTGTEQVPLGQFYLTSWGSPSEYSVEFKGNDLLYKLNNTYYFSKMYSNAKVSTIVGDILSDYSSTIKYNIADNIKDVTLTGYIPMVSYREALQHVCFASGGVCYVDRYGTLQIKRIDTTAQAVETIDFSKKAPSQDKQAELYDSVSVNCYTYNEGTSQELFSGEVTGDQIITFNNPSLVTSVSGTYTSYTAYANCIKIIGASGTIVVTGKPYVVNSQSVTAYLTQDQSVGITKKNMPVDSVYLIGNITTATYVATWLLNCLQKSISNEFQWLSNPSIEVGDFVNLQVTNNLTQKAIVHANHFRYNGAISETSGVVIYE